MVVTQSEVVVTMQAYTISKLLPILSQRKSENGEAKLRWQLCKERGIGLLVDVPSLESFD